MGTPYRLSERLFRRYESAIGQVLQSWPKAVHFQPQNVETFSCRLRDAIKGVLANNWRTSLDLQKLAEIRSQLRVSTTVKPGCVSVGPADALRSGAEEVDILYTSGLTVKDPPPEVVQALAILHHHRVLSQPTRIVGSFDMSVVERYDIAVVDDGNSKLML